MRKKCSDSLDLISKIETILISENSKKMEIFRIFRIFSDFFGIESHNSVNITDSQNKVEVIARKRIQNFMLALGNLIITTQKNQNSVV